jgi:hydroxymethylglutaryl-CoA lyase
MEASAEPERGGHSAAHLTWVECPRDAWQGLPHPIPARAKREHLRSLLNAGFRSLDLGSFVSPRAVPQMADTEEVLAGLERPMDADFIGIIANRRGLERALACGALTTVGYPLSLSETFQLRNSGVGLDTSWGLASELPEATAEGGIGLVVYLSMGFGNPYGEEWAPERTGEAVARLRRLGVTRIALADTVGRADGGLVAGVLAACERPAELGVHLHARPDGWQDVVGAAWDAGVRWFEGALAGIGGCPFAGDELVGNLPSERVLPWLASRSGEEPVRLASLPALAREAGELAVVGGAGGAGGADSRPLS